jgi:hypothetical protein
MDARGAVGHATFAIQHREFFRHSDFVIRHFAFGFRNVSAAATNPAWLN